MTPSHAFMNGRTCMITGASSGIGRATALGLAQLGARLVLVCRDRDRAELTRTAIQQETGNNDVMTLLADLSSQESIRQLAGKFLATGEPLHVLINNAGVVNNHPIATVDGIETVFAVNHLAYLLLTLLLLPRLKESAPARIINVASDAHRHATINFADLGGAHRYQTTRQRADAPAGGSLQDMNHVELMRPITKWAISTSNPSG